MATKSEQDLEPKVSSSTKDTDPESLTSAPLYEESFDTVFLQLQKRFQDNGYDNRSYICIQVYIVFLYCSYIAEYNYSSIQMHSFTYNYVHGNHHWQTLLT